MLCMVLSLQPVSVRETAVSHCTAALGTATKRSLTPDAITGKPVLSFFAHFRWPQTWRHAGVADAMRSGPHLSSFCLRLRH